MTEIRVEDLRSATQRLFDAIEGTFGPTLDLGEDHYWLLEPAEAHRSTASPTASSVGSLADDVDSVNKLVEQKDREVVLWHDLAHMTGVLSKIAELHRRNSTCPGSADPAH